MTAKKKKTAAVEAPQPETPTTEPAAEVDTDRPEYFHERQLEAFRQDLAEHGEAALARWGLAMVHSLSDEEFEAQRRAWGIEPTDALDCYNRGCLCAAEEDFQQASTMFDQAIELNERQPDERLAVESLMFNRALTIERLGNTDAAREAWKAYVEQFAEEEDTEEVKAHLASLA